MKIRTYLCLALMLGTLFTGCGSSNPAPAANNTSGAVTEATTEDIAETAHATENATIPETENALVSEKEEPSEDEISVPSEDAECELEDGIYTASFKSDSSMFHLNETCDGRGVLTVENGQMTIHLTMVSKKIVTLYAGSKADAVEDEANWILPTTDEVTYSDGMTEEVYGFDLPVPVIGEKFPCALIGTHDNWYDHMVVVSDVQPAE